MLKVMEATELPTLEDLQPLYEAVVHGCLADRKQETCDEVYSNRILRGTTGHGSYHSTRQLGAIGADLGAVAAFFEEPWSRLSPSLRPTDQVWLLSEAAFRLCALGRLTEAVEPMKAGTEMIATNRNHGNAAYNAASAANNLSELEVTLGKVKEAVTDARQFIEITDRSGDAFWRMGIRTAAADALHQSGEREEARRLFEQAEALQRERQPQLDLLYSLQGFRYCDLILAPAERAAWQRVVSGFSPSDLGIPTGIESSSKQSADGLKPETTLALAALAEAERRAKQTLEWMQRYRGPLLSIALDHLTLARVALYRALLEPLRPSSFDLHHFTVALDGLRKAGQMQFVPLALLTAALHAHLSGDEAAASRALAEAQQIAERGPMPLFLADVHLHRARLFRDKAELAKARTLIEKHGYGRRKDELADAEAASAHW